MKIKKVEKNLFVVSPDRGEEFTREDIRGRFPDAEVVEIKKIRDPRVFKVVTKPVKKAPQKANAKAKKGKK